ILETSVKEGVMRRWFKDVLITPAGTRATVFRGETETGGLPNAVVDLLENLHLVRPEMRGSARWYELTHDRFLEPIREANRKWRRERERELQQAQALAAEQQRRAEAERERAEAQQLRTQEQARAVRRLRQLALALGIASVFVAGTAFLTWLEWRQAKIHEQEAQNS